MAAYYMGPGPVPDEFGGIRGYKKAIDEYAAPDECETSGCSDEPDMYIEYTNPEEKVYYCSIHGNQHRTDQNAVDWDYI